MSFEINEEVRIEAPVECVWEVVSDLPRYSEWNPFVIECRSSLEVGDPIDMRVQIFPAFAQSQREQITEYEVGRRFCYGLPGHFPRVLRSRRCHHLTTVGERVTLYRSEFGLFGPLAPVVRGLLGKRLGIGFQAMTEGIRKRAEEIASLAGRGADDAR